MPARCITLTPARSRHRRSPERPGGAYAVRKPSAAEQPVGHGADGDSVHATVRGDRARQLECGQRRRDRARREIGGSGNLVCTRRSFAEPGEHERLVTVNGRRHGGCFQPERLEHVRGAKQRGRTETKQRVRAGRERGGALDSSEAR